MFAIFYFWTFNNLDLLKYGISCFRLQKGWNGCRVATLFTRTSRHPICSIVLMKIIGIIWLPILNVQLELWEHGFEGHLTCCKFVKIRLLGVNLELFTK
jgi:hypothetical protein